MQKIAVQNQRGFGFSSGISFNLSRVLFTAVQLQCRSELRSLVFRYRSHRIASQWMYLNWLVGESFEQTTAMSSCG